MPRRPSTRVVLPVLAALVAGCSMFAPGEADQGTVDVLDVGTCFDTATGDAGTTVDVIDCEQPHQYEVFHKLAVPGPSYPGEDALRIAGDEGCLAQFESYVGTPYEDSELDVEPILPEASAWDGRGEPQIRCALFDDAGIPLEEPARGSNR